MEKFSLTFEEACTCVTFMDSIKGCLSWIAFIEDGADGTKSIRVRLRSRFVPVNTVAEKYRGGGHDCACGATVYNKKEVEALVADVDQVVRAYKDTHDNWL